MTKATVGCSVNHNEKTIVLTKAYAKKANTPGTKEFRELSKLHKAYPDYDIVMRTATITADKDTHGGLTIERDLMSAACHQFHFDESEFPVFAVFQRPRHGNSALSR